MTDLNNAFDGPIRDWKELKKTTSNLDDMSLENLQIEKSI